MSARPARTLATGDHRCDGVAEVEIAERARAGIEQCSHPADLRHQRLCEGIDLHGGQLIAVLAQSLRRGLDAEQRRP